MGVITTPNIYKALSFDGTSSRTYGVFITGEAVYNAPERAVEMISIPGRNGAFALDKGHFENITVTYSAGIFAENEEDFSEAISDFRNFLCSKTGYCRLTDEYNPDEYRLAVYKSGLEVSPEQLKAGEFELVFDCKPQRFLTSGETETAVANNGTITNPTLFDSRPILKFQGYGNIGIGGETITVDYVPIGDVIMSDGETTSYQYTTNEVTLYYELYERAKIVIDGSILNATDNIFIDNISVITNYNIIAGDYYADGVRIEDQVGSDANAVGIVQDEKNESVVVAFNPVVFQKGTAKTLTHEHRQYVKVTNRSGGYNEFSGRRTTELKYDGANTITLSSSNVRSNNSPRVVATAVSTIGQISANSTMLASGVFNVNLDIGEAYWLNNNTPIDANYAVSLSAELPTLKPGNNTITYDNTITNFKIVPNWWKV